MTLLARIRPLFALPLLLAALPALADDETAPREIRDNSFLIEEAFNQEPGVIQHIFTFARERESHNWFGTFTEEWPVKGMTHQLSISIPFQHLDTDRASRLGDVFLNYRYQLTGGGEDDRVSIAPRVSVILPSGNDKAGSGTGGTGLELFFPVSVLATDRLAMHWNAGGNWIGSAKDPAGGESSLETWKFGMSGVFLASHNANLLLEAMWVSAETFDGAGGKSWNDAFVVSPGIRCAMDFSNDLQVVAGLAVPIGVGPSRHENSVLLYLSFEHPFGPAK